MCGDPARAISSGAGAKPPVQVSEHWVVLSFCFGKGCLGSHLAQKNTVVSSYPDWLMWLVCCCRSLRPGASLLKYGRGKCWKMLAVNLTQSGGDAMPPCVCVRRRINLWSWGSSGYQMSDKSTTGHGLRLKTGFWQSAVVTKDAKTILNGMVLRGCWPSRGR